MLQYRTDLAMEAHELLCARSRAQTISGADSRTVFRRGCSVTSVRIDTESAARQLGKPCGRYVTLDLSPLKVAGKVPVVFKDGANAEKFAQDYEKTTITVPADGKVTVHLAPGGSVAMEII